MTSSGGHTVSHIGADDTDLKEGQQVGDYIIQKKIGEGGFGTVFSGEHPLIGKMVAIKVLNRQYSSQPEMVSRFVAEARAVNQIRHRHIIDIFGFGQLEDGRHYYIMELLDGMPMDEYLDDCGQLPMEQAIPILRSVARALDAAHSKGIAHRDLKPENIFLVNDSDEGMYPKLLDFGIAKLLSSDNPAEHKTRTGAPMGTPHYMSPEQCRGRDVDHRTDIYAFGVVTYVMLTGELPFDGEDYMDILLAQISDEAAPPSTHAPHLPQSVDAGIGWMLRKDPGERPPNLVTAVRALEDAAQSAGIPIPAGPAPSGVYAASTTALSRQRTPSVVTPLPNGFASAETVMPDQPGGPASDVFAAQPAPAKGKGMMLALALIGAVVVGGGVFFAVSSTKSKKADKPDKTEQTEDKLTKLALKPKKPDPPPKKVVPPVKPDIKPDIKKPVKAKIKVVGAPKGAEVYDADGLLVGEVPGPLELDKTDDKIKLTFKMAGYHTRTYAMRVRKDGVIKVPMRKIRRRTSHTTRPKPGKTNTTKGNKGRDSLEDPFAKKKPK